ncbi:hypothetical protein CYMTET_23282 [Cymbomonas tetramitiformis]|uniref:Uncharacterized protein n=1 Tax=Cymbomonas tetramitiformis TaxID=36881 RepID=A0AAE0L197_9CHLO|nr:hypothetical protein CYMTET_23282 [Cymbomonas tetramitiformis]
MSLVDVSARNESLEAATSAWAKTCQLDLLILTGAFYPAPEEFCRQLLIIPCKESMRDALPRLVAFLNDKGVELKDLKLCQLPQDSVAYVHVDNAYSRKRLQPIVDSFFHAGI